MFSYYSWYIWHIECTSWSLFPYFQCSGKHSQIDCISSLFLNNCYNYSVMHLENFEIMSSISKIIYNAQEFFPFCITFSRLHLSRKLCIKLNFQIYWQVFIVLFCFCNICKIYLTQISPFWIFLMFDSSVSLKHQFG